MKIVLEIKDSKAAAFVNFIKSLNFIRIHQEEEYMEPTKEEILQSIERGIKEVELYEKGAIKLQPARDFLNEV
ncbi:MAG TPA: hypothetical protein VFM65_10630 [Flavobacteriaceae bacterium]|nr:hypothetical protein [Flavobacteriaceae bacterium]